MTTISAASSTPLPIASATAPNWLNEAESAILAQANQGGMLGTLQNSGRDLGSLASFFRYMQNGSSALALIAQNSAATSAAATVSARQASDIYGKAQASQIVQNLLAPPPINATPSQGLDPIIFFEDGSTLDTISNIFTFADGRQIDSTTGLPYIEPGSIIDMPDGSFLDTKNNVLTMPDGTRIDTVTGLIITT